MIYDVGDSATVTTELRDTAGNLTAATVAITVTKPDGSALSPTPTVSDNGGTGKYKTSFVVDAVGTWKYKWTASGALVAVDGGQLSVQDAGRVLVASIDELRAQLDRADFTEDSELRLYLEAATNQVEWLVGPLTTTTITERQTAPDRIALRKSPLVSVTSVKRVVAGVPGDALPTTDYTVDPDVNELRLARWSVGRSEYEVVYIIGRTSIPADIKLAGLIIAQHLWSVQNARFTLNAPGEDELAVVPGSGFMVPYRALELLRPYLSVATVGGIA